MRRGEARSECSRPKVKVLPCARCVVCGYSVRGTGKKTRRMQMGPGQALGKEKEMEQKHRQNESGRHWDLSDRAPGRVNLPLLPRWPSTLHLRPRLHSTLPSRRDLMQWPPAGYPRGGAGGLQGGEKGRRGAGGYVQLGCNVICLPRPLAARPREEQGQSPAQPRPSSTRAHGHVVVLCGTEPRPDARCR